MKLTRLVIAGALASSFAAPQLFAADAFNAEQKKDIEKVVHEYLVNNPEVLLEVSTALQQKQQKSMQQQAESAIEQNATSLFNGKLTVVGNPKGDVTVVEFFDYQCIHCKKMSPVIDSLLKADKNVRVIYKEFPIFGKTSELGSRAALAAGMQGKYLPMHEALFKIEGQLTEENIMAAGKAIGLDDKKLKADMSSKVVNDELDANRQLAEKLHLMGTPAFIVASTPKGQFKVGSQPTFIPGAASLETLQDLVKKVQAK